MDIKKLGRFEIVDEIGSGGMGLVYKGRDPKINRMVALKVIRPTLGGKLSAEQQQAADRFYVEAQAAGSLSHPNIVTIYDVGEEKTAQGALVYIAMEFLEGRGLDWYIANKKLPTFESKVKVVRAMAEGLDYAHKRGVIHRDVKPANIIITSELQPKITDFGLARLSDSSMTMSGTILGTPNYMAPEQVQGKKVDARSDLFSLTVVFYEMLTGEKPFAADSITSVIYKVVNEEPLPPRRVNIDLPPKIDGMIKRGLAKDPAQRYQSGADYIAALDALLADGDDDMAMDAMGDTTLVMNRPIDNGAKKSGSIKFPMLGGNGKKPPLALVGGVGGALVVILALVFGMGGGEDEKADVAAKPTSTPTQSVKLDADGKPDDGRKPVKVDEVGGKVAPPIVKEQPTPVPTRTPTPAPKQEAPAATDFTYLTVTTDAKGADVLIDNKFIGQTPLNNAKVTQGTHTLTIKKSGYETYTKKIRLTSSKADFPVTLTKGETTSAKPVSANANFGTLKVIAPAGSMIVVDGQSYQKDHLTLDRLSPGSHIVYIQTKGKKPFTETISIRAGETKVIKP
jgi:serine/threonine protein kinase